MIDIIILILIIAGFLVTYTLVLVCYWLNKRNEGMPADEQRSIRSVLGPLEVQLLWPKETPGLNLGGGLGLEGDLKIGGTSDRGEQRIDTAFKMGTDEIKPATLASPDIRDRLGMEMVKKIEAMGLSVAGATLGPVGFQLSFQVESSTPYLFSIPSEFTLKFDTAQSIIIVDDIMNRADGISANFEIEDTVPTTVLQLSLDAATQTLKMKVLKNVTTDVCGKPGADSYSLGTAIGDFSITVEPDGAGAFNVIPFKTDGNFGTVLSLKDKTIEISVSSDEQSVCVVSN